MKLVQLIILLIAILFFADLTYGQGCSQCKLLAEQGSELDEASFGSNINYGILYLMTIPYIIIALIFRKQIFAFLKRIFRKKQP